MLPVRSVTRHAGGGERWLEVEYVAEVGFRQLCQQGIACSSPRLMECAKPLNRLLPIAVEACFRIDPTFHRFDEIQHGTLRKHRCQTVTTSWTRHRMNPAGSRQGSHDGAEVVSGDVERRSNLGGSQHLVGGPGDHVERLDSEIGPLGEVEAHGGFRRSG